MLFVLQRIFKTFTFKTWMPISAQLNILDDTTQLRYSLFYSECTHNVMQTSCLELSELQCVSCYMVSLHYGTFGITKRKELFLTSTFDSGLYNEITTDPLKILLLLFSPKLNLKDMKNNKNDKETLGLINAFKYVNMSQFNFCNQRVIRWRCFF